MYLYFSLLFTGESGGTKREESEEGTLAQVSIKGVQEIENEKE